MNYLIYSVMLLALAALFKTVLCSFSQTEEGGVARLSRKYPKIVRRTRIYVRRWSLMTASLSLLNVVAGLGSAAMLFAAYRTGYISAVATLAAFGLLVVLHQFFVEMLPKSVADNYSDRISAIALPATIFASFLLIPIVAPLMALERWFAGHLESNSCSRDRPSAEEEIISLMEQADARDIDLHEKKFIRSVFDFDETDVHEIMTPRIEIEAIADTETVAECALRVRDLPHSRFPVFHEGLDEIVGIVHVKDIMRMLSIDRDEERVGDIASPAAFVPESMKIVKLFELIKLRRTHLAVVVDEYGGTAGVVALEDVIEELIGDIQDESDEEVEGISRMPDGSWNVIARESIADVNEVTGAGIPESDQYDSVGGYVFGILNRIPVEGESVTTSDFTITVQKASDRQIESVRISLAEDPV